MIKEKKSDGEKAGAFYWLQGQKESNMKVQRIIVTSVILFSVAIGISLAIDTKKDGVYACKAIKNTSIECSRTNSECVSKVGSDDDEILLTNPKSVSPRIMRGSSPYNLKRLSVTRDSKSYYLSTTGDLGGMTFYLWLPESNNFFEIKAHTMFGDFSATTLYQCQRK